MRLRKPSDASTHRTPDPMIPISERFETRAERFEHEAFALDLLLPRAADDLIDEAEFDTDERLPYWAELWPSARALSRELLDADPPAGRVAELGCGLALPSLVLAARGIPVVATDYYGEALEFVRLNAERNGITAPDTRLLDWRRHDPALGTFDLVLAADVLYEERNAHSLAGVLPVLTAPGGMVRIADPGRAYRQTFERLMLAGGWRIADERVRVERTPVTDRVLETRVTLLDLVRVP